MARARASTAGEEAPSAKAAIGTAADTAAAAAPNMARRSNIGSAISGAELRDATTLDDSVGDEKERPETARESIFADCRVLGRYEEEVRARTLRADLRQSYYGGLY